MPNSGKGKAFDTITCSMSFDTFSNFNKIVPDDRHFERNDMSTSITLVTRRVEVGGRRYMNLVNFTGTKMYTQTICTLNKYYILYVSISYKVRSASNQQRDERSNFLCRTRQDGFEQNYGHICSEYYIRR